MKKTENKIGGKKSLQLVRKDDAANCYAVKK